MPHSLAERIAFALEAVDCPQETFAVVFLEVGAGFFSRVLREQRPWPRDLAARAEIALRFILTTNEKSPYPVNFHIHKKIRPVWRAHLESLAAAGVPTPARSHRPRTENGTKRVAAR